MMEDMWQAMESIWPVVLIVMVVFGATVSHLGGIVLERLRTLELRVGLIQEQVHFLERLRESDPRGLSETRSPSR